METNFFENQQADRIYAITLADGTVLSNLRLNGTNFITNELVTSSTFYGNCSPVLISDGERDEVHEHMELVQIACYKPGEYWIALRDLSQGELREMRSEAQMTYTAMMTDTLLEE